MSKNIKTEIVDPDAPVRFVRLEVDGEEQAMIPWDEAKSIASTVNEEVKVQVDVDE